MPIEVALAQSDVVAVATVVDVKPARWTVPLRIRIDRTLYGDLSGELDVELEGSFRAGDTVLVNLTRRAGRWKAVLDGSVPWSASLEKRRVAQLQNKPAWPDAKDGWSFVFVVEDAPRVPPKDTVDGWVVYRNRSDATATFAYTEWPPESHTHWSLEVTRDGATVAPIPHPHLTPDEIRGYFAEHGNTFDVDLEPGQTFALPLQRIASAEPGWGHKQRLGFQYWPMDTSGTYRVVARDVRRGLVAPAITLER